MGLDTRRTVRRAEIGTGLLAPSAHLCEPDEARSDWHEGTMFGEQRTRRQRAELAEPPLGPPPPPPDSPPADPCAQAGRFRESTAFIRALATAGRPLAGASPRTARRLRPSPAGLPLRWLRSTAAARRKSR